VSEGDLHVSVIICTRDRADALRQTLAALAAADRAGLRAEVVVVDNASRDATPEVIATFRESLACRYLYEPRVGSYGKSHALNCALAAGRLGELVAVLDDDLSVAPDWFHGVVGLARRHPEAGLFTGRMQLRWPAGDIPPWAHDRRIHGWLFSVYYGSAQDRAPRQGQWFPGGHFWFRAHLAQAGRRFADAWLTEPQFMLQLIEEGVAAVAGPDAVVTHRIQPRLLDPSVALERAGLVGRSFAEARLRPCRASVRHARWAHRHPLAARGYCLAAWWLWGLRCWRLRHVTGREARFAERLIAVERRANFRETLRILASEPAYRVWRRAPALHAG